jgi:membrane peptidoglycan carboxypeptidase
VSALVDQEGRTVARFGPQIIRTLPLSPANWALLREGMEAGYSSTLLRHVRIPGLRVAGKTGTAEYYGPRNERGELPTHAWYTGFAPVDQPEIAVTVFVERGTGSNDAAPIATRIFRHYFGLPDAPPGTPAPPPAPPPAGPPTTPAPAGPPSATPATPITAPTLGASTATPQPAAATVPPAAPAPATAPPAATAPPTSLPRPAAPTLGRPVGGAPAGSP